MNDYSKMFDLSGRRALVIGGASGIGRASCFGLASFGAQVICGDIDLAKAKDAALAIQAHELVHAVDDCQHKHGKEFKKLALAIGLAGKMCATHAGEALTAGKEPGIFVVAGQKVPRIQREQPLSKALEFGIGDLRSAVDQHGIGTLMRAFKCPRVNPA